MTIVSSGAISLVSLATEYGGGAPHAMSEYYHGAGLVNDAGVPSSGAIALSTFYGRSALSLTNPFPGGLIEASGIHPGSATAEFVIYPNGTSSTGNWCSPTGGTPGNSKYVYFALTSGSSPTGGSPLNTWMDISINRSIAMTRNGAGGRSGTFDVYVAPNADGSGQVSPGSVTLSAVVGF